MATFYSDAAKPRNPAKTGVQFPIIVPFTLAITTAPAVNDLYELAKIPKDAIVVDFGLDVPDMDTGGPTLTFELGDRVTSDKFMGNSTDLAAGAANGFTASGWGGARVRSTGAALTADPSEGSLPTTPYAAEDALVLKCTAAATTFAAGTVRGFLAYTMA